MAHAGFLFFLVSALNAGIILTLIYKARYTGWKLAGLVFLVSFGIQYFMSQIETVWFNDSLGLPGNGIAAIVLGGAFTLVAFSRLPYGSQANLNTEPTKAMIVIVLDLVSKRYYYFRQSFGL